MSGRILVGIDGSPGSRAAAAWATREAGVRDAEIEAVYITDDLARGEELRRRWEAMHISTPLVVLDSPIRHHTTALLRYLDFIQRRTDEHEVFVTVVLPEVLPTRWWHPLVHNYFAWPLKWILLFRPRTAVTSVPYEVRD